jgi:hypothetical protein
MFWTVEWWNPDDDWKDYAPIVVQPAYVQELEVKFEEYAATGARHTVIHSVSSPHFVPRLD